MSRSLYVTGEPITRVLSYLQPQEDGCWRWQGSTSPGGYGQIRIARRLVAVHRWVYEFYVGPIPEGFDVDHVCHNNTDCAGGPTCLHRRCAFPDHLEAVPHIINVQRGKNGILQSARTHCPSGHEYNAENTLRDKKGRRVCRECHRASSLRWWHEKRLGTIPTVAELVPSVRLAELEAQFDDADDER